MWGKLLFFFNYLPEKLALLQVFGYQKQTFFCLDDLVEVQDVAVSNLTQNRYFILHSRHVFWSNTLLVDQLHCHFLVSRQVQGQMNLPEGPLSDVFAYILSWLPKR